MSEQHLLHIYHKLPSDLKQEVIDFIEFLVAKKKLGNEEVSSLEKARRNNFGRLRGRVQMADDFDDPVEGFEQYMP